MINPTVKLGAERRRLQLPHPLVLEHRSASLQLLRRNSLHQTSEAFILKEPSSASVSIEAAVNNRTDHMTQV